MNQLNLIIGNLPLDLYALHSCGQDERGRFKSGNTCWKLKKNIQAGVQRATKKIKEEEAKESKAKPASPQAKSPSPIGTGSAGEGQATPSTPAKSLPRLTPAEKAAGEARRAEREKDEGKPIIPLGTLAGHIKEAASRVGPEGRIAPDSDKVFISHAHKEFAKTPHGKGMSLDEFKNNLKLMNTNRHLDLSRADLVEAMNPDDVKESETLHKPMGNQGSGSAFHFVRAEQAKRAEGQPAEGATQGEKGGQSGQDGTPVAKSGDSPIEKTGPRTFKAGGKEWRVTPLSRGAFDVSEYGPRGDKNVIKVDRNGEPLTAGTGPDAHPIYKGKGLAYEEDVNRNAATESGWNPDYMKSFLGSNKPVESAKSGEPNPSGQYPESLSTPPRKIKLAGKSPTQRRAVVAVANALQARQAFNEAKGRGDGEETLNSLRERANSLSQAAQPHLKAARKEGKMAGEAPGPKIAEGTAGGGKSPEKPNVSEASGRTAGPVKIPSVSVQPSSPSFPFDIREESHPLKPGKSVFRAYEKDGFPVGMGADTKEELEGKLKSSFPHKFQSATSSPLSPLGSPAPAKPEAPAKPVSAPATPPATPPVAVAFPKSAATATPKPSPKPVSPTPSRDRSPGAAASRIQSRVRTALENVGRHPDNLQARKAMDRLRGRDLQASGILRAKEAGQSGYFGKLRGMRESGRSAPGVATPPPAPAPSLPTVPYEGPGKGPIPSAGGQAKGVAASPASPVSSALPASPASPASSVPSRALNPSEMSRSDNLYRSANESQLHTLASRVKAPLPPSTGDPFKDRQLLADSITRTIHDNPNLGDRAWRAEVSALLPAQLSDSEAEVRRKESAFAERAPSRGASYKSGNKNVHY